MNFLTSNSSYRNLFRTFLRQYFYDPLTEIPMNEEVDLEPDDL